MRKPYPSDLSDAQWRLIEPRLPGPKAAGRPIEYERREVVNAIFYVVRTGCSWRSMPHDFPPWRTVYYYFMTWRRQGLWQRLNDLLREQVRRLAGRHGQPSAAIIDSQSVKTTERGGPAATTRARRSRGASGTFSSTCSA